MSQVIAILELVCAFVFTLLSVKLVYVPIEKKFGEVWAAVALAGSVLTVIFFYMMIKIA